MKSADNYSLLIEKINVFIRKYYFNRFLRGLIFLGAGLFSAYVVITVGEYFGDFSSTFRTILFYFFIFLNLGFVCWLILPALLGWLKVGKTLSYDQAAEIIGTHFSDVKDKLLNTLQLKKLANADPQHHALIEASIDQKIEKLRPISFPSAINLRENNKYLKWVIFPAAVICILAFAAPSILTESTKKLIRHNEYFAPVAPFSFVVENRSLAVVQGDDLNLQLKLKGDKLPNDVYVETASNTFRLDKDNVTRFHYLFTNLQQNTSFRLSANGFNSQIYQIKVNQRPALLHFDVDLNYPAYLHKKNETLANAGDLTIPAGTVVKWHFRTQHATGLIFYMNGTQGRVTPEGADAFGHQEHVIKNSVFKVNPVNAEVTHSDSASYRINVIADEPPTITVQEKQDSVSIKAMYFEGTIQDDHGFSSLTFNYRVGDPNDKAHQKTYSRAVKADLGQTQSNFFYYWNLKDMGIKPGDQVTYYFEVADNDGVNGPKKARSPEHTLNIPDANELNNQLNEGTEVVKQKMESAMKLAGQIERESQKLNEMLLDKNNMSFDEKKQIQDLMQKKKDLDDLVKQIRDESQKNLYNRQQNQQQTEQLTQKQQQMQDLLNQLLDPKTQEMLQRLQEMLQEDQKDATRDQLSKMQMDNKDLRKELDRMLELYRKMDFEQKLNQNAEQLKNLSNEQQQLADQAKQPGADPQSLQQEQKNLNKNFDQIKKSLDDLDKTNQQNAQKQDFQNPKQEEQSISQKMQQSTDDLGKNQPQKAAQSQQQAADEMNQLAEKMQQKEQEGEESQNMVDAGQLRQLLKNLINSSFDQEAVMQTLKTTATTDPNYLQLAQKQKSIEDNLKTAEDTLYALSRRIPQIQTTVNKEVTSINDHIDQALQNMGDRVTPEATRNQQYAMTSMNNLALLLSEALDQLQNAMKNGRAGKGKGKQISVSDLARQQQQLNQNMERARQQMEQQGNKGKSAEGNGENISEQFAKLARQQQQIREALQQFNRDENKDGTNGLGNLDKISQQMEQTERDLVNRRITEESLKRQQQIQSRLLEAEKAEQQREQDQQRESHAGKDIPPGYIKALQQYQQSHEKQTEQVKTIPPALNFYYILKIKSYFELLNAK